MGRIKYYGSSDLSIGYHFDRLKNLIEVCDEMELDNLLGILEAYNVLKFIKDKIYFTDLSDNQIKKAKKRFNKEVNQFFSKISKEDILIFFRYFFFKDESKFNGEIAQKMGVTSIDKPRYTLFREDFLECFEIYKLDHKISGDDLRKCIAEYSVPIWYFLKTQYFISTYPDLIKEFFLMNPSNFELLLNNYTANATKYFLPTNINKIEMYQFCESYIEYEDANLNYLRLINQGIQGISELKIDAKLKLKSKRRCEQIEQEIFNDEEGYLTSGVGQNIALYIEKEAYDRSKEDLKGLIDLEYLKKENSKENLLEYMMYFDYFFTENWILNLCSFPNFESSTMVRILSGIRTKKNYETSFYFNNKNSLLLLTFKVYQEKLEELFNLRIEELIAYFFSSYSKENFHTQWLPLDFSNGEEKKHIQTKNLFTLEEQIRKQWKLYFEESKVDKELFELESTPRLNSLRSFLDKKYIYANEKNENISKIMHLLFSDQSNIIYINEELKGKNFLQLIVENKIKKENFHNYQQVDLDFLLENKVISLGEDSILFTDDKQLLRIFIILDIYRYGVIHYYHWNQKLSIKDGLKYQQQEIDEMIREGLLICESSLFSKPEVDYLDYLLNDSKYDNSLGLRNKYLHGSVVDEKENDYLFALIVLVLYTIKINEELSIRDDLY